MLPMMVMTVALKLENWIEGKRTVTICDESAPYGNERCEKVTKDVRRITAY